MNKAVQLDLWIVEIIKIAVHDFCCDYLKPKYSLKVKFCFIVQKVLKYNDRRNFPLAFQGMFKQKLVVEITNQTGHYLNEKMKKIMWINER